MRTTRPTARDAVHPLALARHRHAQLTLPVTLALTAALVAAGPVALWAQVVVLAVGVGLIGMPHGAMDHRVAERLMRPRLGRRWGPLFALAYLGLAGIVVAVWQVAPAAALVGFLVISVVHFGLGDAESPDDRATRGQRAVLAGARGLLPIALPIAFHPGEVAKLFGWLMPAGPNLSAGSMEQLAVTLGFVTLPVWLALLVVYARRQAWLTVGELLLMPAVFFLLPPLIGFAIYFCLWHSARHLLDLAWLLGHDARSERAASADVAAPMAAGCRRLAVEAAPLTLLTLAGMAVAGVLLLPRMEVVPAVVHVTFVTLSALTVPHMLVTAWANARGDATAREANAPTAFRPAAPPLTTR